MNGSLWSAWATPAYRHHGLISEVTCYSHWLVCQIGRGGELAVSESESARLVQAAGVEIRTSAAEAMRQAAALDHRYSAAHVSGTVRQVLAAWVMAVDGDGTALAAIAEPGAAHDLLHPGGGSPWQVTPGPRVTRIEVWGLEPDRAPPELRAQFRFTGHRRFDDPNRSEQAGADPNFVGSLGLKLPDSGPWQLFYGRIETLDEYEHYVFVSRRETPAEYRRRTGSSARPVAAAGPVRGYRIIAGFAEHDERFGSQAEVEVSLPAAPTREEAVRLVWPAVEEETTRALGEGAWRPSLNWVDVFELLDGAPSG